MSNSEQCDCHIRCTAVEAMDVKEKNKNLDVQEKFSDKNGTEVIPHSSSCLFHFPVTL